MPSPRLTFGGSLARSCSARALSRSARSLYGGSLAGLIILTVAPSARADEPLHTMTWSQEALAGLEPQESHESPALRALRLAEEELFAKDQTDGAVLGAATEPPEAPPARLERPGGAVDLGFLKDLKLPALPVRWDTRVIEYLLFFKDDPRGRELASAWLKRRERYGPMVRRILAEHALPADLQYLAMIESGYDPLACSHADAWGMWQFIKEPAAYYGLRVDHWADERLDPERSTRAAARFLRDLYERFGSWDLTFAAYNMGYGGLLRAIKKYNTNDYWTLSHLEAGLPFETSLYVAKITAMAIVGHNPERFGFGKLTHDTPLTLAQVDVQPGAALADVASAAGLSLDALRAVNPHLKQSRVPPGEPAVRVYLPKEAQVRFVQRWSERKAEQPIAYTVRFGESLDDVARRAGLSVQKLRELNELPPETAVKPGFPLLVPHGAKPTSDLVEPLVATVPAKTFRLPDRKRVFYRVSAQDTQDAVARYFHVTKSDLASWNALAPSAALQPGMLLQVFVKPEIDLSQVVVFDPREVRVLTVGSNEFFDYHESQRGRVRVRYRVRKNDTLEALGERFGLSPGSIGRINQFPTNHELKAGEWVVVYVPEEKVAELDAKGSIERIGRGEAAVAAVARKQEVDPEGDELVERKKPVLPEAEGERVVETKKELPMTPPARKPGAVATPARPIVKAPKQAKRQL